ncbi:MAG TPA: AmmeMemoRadiSam system protein B [Nitrososphaeraceae archaeon]|nr:AmmeMemoRadiSam system protein B [Nitrososphaeraceae archaeon]
MRDLTSRSPYYAGSFYPKHTCDLIELLHFCFNKSIFGPKKKQIINTKIFGIIVPHGAYIFSGAISANAFFEIASLNIDTFILIGPDHHGIGKRISVTTEGYWQTPLGDVLIDNTITNDLKRSCDFIEEDNIVHQIEHSLEIHVPFIQYSFGNSFTIVPLLLRDQDIETSMLLGNLIAKYSARKNVMIIASSCLTHYESNSSVHKKDFQMIKNIESLNIESFYQSLMNLKASVCGYGAIASLMRAVQILGSKKGELLRYATSGDVTSDNKNTVVGYASIAFI